MKKLITLAALLHLGASNASIVAIMDTGTDISHKDLAAKAWTNAKEKPGSLVDLDGSGLPGDMHGWDFTEGSAKVFNDKYNHLLTEDVKKFYTLYAKYETKTAVLADIEWLKAAVANKPFMNQANFIGGYAHGTHVGGIATLNNPNAKVMSLKILPTVYTELAPTAAGNSEVKTPVQLDLFDTIPTATYAEFKAEVIKTAVDQVKQMIPLNTYLKFHNVDVVNQSFGIGFNAAVEFIATGFVETLKREPTDAELRELLVAYFMTFRQIGSEMFKVAPTTLFVIAAGNDTSDNDLYPDYPADIQAANKIVVAATFGYSEIAEFSNFGATKVDVAAPGVAILSPSPAQNYLHMSGTSQAAPFVTNAVSLAKDVNPALTTADLKSIILKTVDVKPWLKGKVVTSGIVNKARVLRAAELSKTMNVEVAIAKAKVEVADVTVPKSAVAKVRLPGMKVNYRPLRPSLLVKIPSL